MNYNIPPNFIIQDIKCTRCKLLCKSTNCSYNWELEMCIHCADLLDLWKVIRELQKDLEKKSEPAGKK